MASSRHMQVQNDAKADGPDGPVGVNCHRIEIAELIEISELGRRPFRLHTPPYVAKLPGHLGQGQEALSPANQEVRSIPHPHEPHQVE